MIMSMSNWNFLNFWGIPLSLSLSSRRSSVPIEIQQIGQGLWSSLNFLALSLNLSLDLNPLRGLSALRRLEVRGWRRLAPIRIVP